MVVVAVEMVLGWAVAQAVLRARQFPSMTRGAWPKWASCVDLRAAMGPQTGSGVGKLTWRNPAAVTGTSNSCFFIDLFSR